VNSALSVGQFEYLNKLRKERKMVSLYLLNGIRFMGRIVSFDREGLLLDTRQGEMLFQQRQISTIGPDMPKTRARRGPPTETQQEHRGPGLYTRTPSREPPREPREPREPLSRPGYDDVRPREVVAREVPVRVIRARRTLIDKN